MQTMHRLQRIKINNPITHKDSEGIGEYILAVGYGQHVWDISLDDGERIMLQDHEANLYQLVLLSGNSDAVKN